MAKLGWPRLHEDFYKYKVWVSDGVGHWERFFCNTYKEALEAVDLYRTKPGWEKIKFRIYEEHTVIRRTRRPCVKSRNHVG